MTACVRFLLSKGLNRLCVHRPKGSFFPSCDINRCVHSSTLLIMDTSNVQVCGSSEEQTAILLMKREKVNGFNQSLLEDFSKCLIAVESNSKYNALIISSSIGGVFSAGLDFQVLLKPRREDIEGLWNAMQDTWIHLYSTRLATIAAINGHCLGAGCAFAFLCDSRIARAGDYKVGIIAARVGITAPLWVYEVFSQLVGFHQAEKSLLQGISFTPLDAYNKGMVDELSEGSDEDLIKSATLMSQRYLSVSQDARAEMKLVIRSSLVDKVKANRKQELNEFVDHICSGKVQKYLHSAVH